MDRRFQQSRDERDGRDMNRDGRNMNRHSRGEGDFRGPWGQWAGKEERNRSTGLDTGREKFGNPTRENHGF